MRRVKILVNRCMVCIRILLGIILLEKMNNYDWWLYYISVVIEELFFL